MTTDLIQKHGAGLTTTGTIGIGGGGAQTDGALGGVELDRLIRLAAPRRGDGEFAVVDDFAQQAVFQRLDEGLLRGRTVFMDSPFVGTAPRQFLTGTERARRL